MLFQFGMSYKRDAVGPGKSFAIPAKAALRRILPRHVVLAAPARQHPFRMFGEPFRGIVLAAHQAGLQRKIIERALLSAGSRCRLQAEDEDEGGHRISLRSTAPPQTFLPGSRSHTPARVVT